MKTTLFSTVIAIMFATGFASCKKEEPTPPRACIAYSSPATINLGETVSFTNCSQNASSAKWEVTPTGEVFVGDLFNYTPTVAGAVIIKLTATNAEGQRKRSLSKYYRSRFESSVFRQLYHDR
jgi:PKD repeat protein